MSAYALSDRRGDLCAAFNGGRNTPRKNVKILNERQKRPRKRAASIAEIKMRKTLVTILCSALIAASSIHAAAAAEHHHTRKASRKPVMVNDQHRNSNNEQPRDSNVSGTCGIFSWPMPMRNRGSEWQFQSGASARSLTPNRR